MLPCVKAAGRRPTVSSPCFPRSPSARSRNSSSASRPEASADRLHPIADAADGADQHLTRMVPQLLAEVADMDLDQMRVGAPLVAPDGPEQRLTAPDPVGSTDQLDQQVELDAGQISLRVVDPDLAGIDVRSEEHTSELQSLM